MSLIQQIGDVLRAGVEPAATARAGYLQGREARRQRERQEGMQDAALERQSRLDLIAAELSKSQTEENRARTGYYKGQAADTSDRDARRANTARDRAATAASQAEQTAEQRRAFAEKYIEAHNGDIQKAIQGAASDPEGQQLFSKGLSAGEFQAAAQRFKDRHTAKSQQDAGGGIGGLREKYGLTPSAGGSATPPSAAQASPTGQPPVDDRQARAAWGRANPPKPGESREQYRARYEASKSGMR